jgi:hypothetical protein
MVYRRTLKLWKVVMLVGILGNNKKRGRHLKNMQVGFWQLTSQQRVVKQ